MRFYVTGATGFIGTHLCRRLVADGHHVAALVRSPHKIADDLRETLEVVPGDLSVFDDPDYELPEVDVIVHLAAVIVGKSQKDYADVNFAAVERLLAVVRNQSWRPKRLLFASSLAAAGPTQGQVLTEDDPPAPVDAYGRAKLDAERLMTEQPFPTTTFRPSIVLGAGDPATLTLYKMAASGFAALPGFRPQPLSLVDVGELVDAFVLMAQASDEEHHLYFATSDIQTTNDDLLRAIAAAMGSRVRIVHIPKSLLYTAMLATTGASSVFGFKNQLDLKQYQQMTAPAFLCSSEKLQRELGWKPRKGLEAILAEAVAGYRKAGELR